MSKSFQKLIKTFCTSGHCKPRSTVKIMAKSNNYLVYSARVIHKKPGKFLSKFNGKFGPLTECLLSLVNSTFFKG